MTFIALIYTAFVIWYTAKVVINRYADILDKAYNEGYASCLKRNQSILEICMKKINECNEIK